MSELGGGLGFAVGVCWKGFWCCLLRLSQSRGGLRP